MRILSWNINGIRTLPQYHPWNTLKTGEAILNELNADIICFQEMKSSRAALERHIALPASYDAFFSFPQTKGGYSGVAVYTRGATSVPLKAEEGITGCIQPKPPLTPAERISHSYPTAHELDDRLMADERGHTPHDLAPLDAEGRALVIDFGLFVLINVYCPNQTSDERLPFKMNFHFVLEERVRLLRKEGREVMVVGDVNVCAAPIDHADGHLPSSKETWWDFPARQWLRKWMAPQGDMIDSVRTFWPTREGMYTCWNMKIGGRETNYGARIDYILVTPGLLPWVKHGDILPSLKGSDHCPTYVDLHEEITTTDGTKRTLRQEMQMELVEGQAPRDPPRLSSKFWDEYSGKQKLLSSFFEKGKAKSKDEEEVTASVCSPAIVESAVSEPVTSSSSLTTYEAPSTPVFTPTVPAVTVSAPEPSRVSEPLSLLDPVSPSSAALGCVSIAAHIPPAPSSSKIPDTPISVRAAGKRKQSDDPKQAVRSSQAKKPKAGQAKLSSFFQKPKSAPSDSPNSPKPSPRSDRAPSRQKSTSSLADRSGPADVIEVDADIAADDDANLDADYRLALQLSAEYSNGGSASQEMLRSPSSSQPTSSPAENKAAWTTLFTRFEPPKCTVHREPAKEFTVNKNGPNKGRAFFVCARPVGPGYDKGKGERLRGEVDHRYKCNFFKWASDAKREAGKGAGDGVQVD